MKSFKEELKDAIKLQQSGLVCNIIRTEHYPNKDQDNGGSKHDRKSKW